jgi:hypothetical protein
VRAVVWWVWAVVVLPRADPRPPRRCPCQTGQKRRALRGTHTHTHVSSHTSLAHVASREQASTVRGARTLVEQEASAHLGILLEILHEELLVLAAERHGQR